MSASRFPRGVIRKLEAGPLFPLRVLTGIRELREYLDRLERRTLADARRLGASTGDIAEVLGITRQGVHHKLKRLDLPKVADTPNPVVIPELEPEA